MNVLWNIAAVAIGVVAGSFFNGALIALSPHVIPPPAGVDGSNLDSLKAGIHLFEAKHFVFPFLAHALGTFAGAFVAYLVAATRREVLAWAMGFLFLTGGIAASFMIPAPPAFIVLDLAAAYLPMAWLAIRLGRKLSAPQA
jgi:hypothetical protein